MNNFAFQTLHREHTRVLILDASEMARQFFGSDGVVGIVGEQTISLKQERAFNLRACGCVVTSLDQVGQTCLICREIADAMGMTEPDFAALCCKVHSRQCCVPTCRMTLCQTHGVEHPADGRCYCPAHLAEFDEQVRKAFFINRWGFAAWLASKPIRAMFPPRETKLMASSCTSAKSIQHSQSGSD